MRIEVGRYTVRLAETEDEVAAAQALRYQVFVEEMGAKASPEDIALKRERDRFDPFCDHLVLVDEGEPQEAAEKGGEAETPTRGVGPTEIVGVYRLLRSSVARNGVGDAPGPGFYTSGEYDLSKIEAHPGETLELGRSCVAAHHRGTAAMQLLWLALSQYIIIHKIDVMFGTASFHGSEIEPLKIPLSFLHHNYLAPVDLRPRAVEGHYVDMNLMPEEEAPRVEAMRLMPALMKGYLRLNGFVGDGAYIDYEFNTVDVCLVMDTEKISDRYKKFYERRAPADVARVLG
ncbi:MAG: GNAT family N-acetyltransferase [Rhodobacteraceae bacterium]|nr:GNAT family N-acetyltransferase [Paracoccaceae bacterium]